MMYSRFSKRILAGTITSVMFIMLAGVTVFAMGKGGQKPVEQGTVAAPAPQASAQGKTAIRDILSDPMRFNSSDVLVQGNFKGWNGTCPLSSMLTRSDWAIEDETGCIYITGAVPAGLSPMQPHNELIKVVGRVMVNDTGRPIIKVSRSDRQSH